MKDSSMSYEEALKVLNYKGKKADLKAIRKAWLVMARKYHPDVNSSSEATRKMTEINSAYERVLRGEKKKTSARMADFRKEYALLKKMVPPGNTSQQVVDKAVAKILAKKSFRSDPNAGERLQMAGERLVTEAFWNDFIMNKVRASKMRSVNRVFMSSEEREIAELQKKADRAIINQTLNKAATWIRGKAKIPLVVKRDGKKYVKYVLATAGLIAAIAAGKYGFDTAKGAYYRKKGTLQVINNGKKR